MFGIKSPTAKFQGRGATLVSRDADVIICDDIEQDKMVSQPTTREKTRNWASTSLFSRKTKRTSIGFIGSRQHPDDLWQHFLDNDLFESIVETAHDETCEIPRNDPTRYAEHVDCMLWPELNDFAWLKEMERDNELLGGRDTFEMVYLNKVTAPGIAMFDAAEIAACRSGHYALGTMPSPFRPEGHPHDEEVGMVRLVGGLDPSGSGYQAAFLWGYQVRPVLKMWMVDIENQEGGGITKARETMERWYDRYDLRHWVVEENLYHGGIVNDEKVTAMRSALSMMIEPHQTQYNKWDRDLGVSTLKPLFANKTIVLPYADTESQVASDLFGRQLIYFSNAPRNRNTVAGYKSDLVMAAWFPMTVIRRARADNYAQMGVQYPATFRGYTGNRWNNVPWGSPMRRTA
jgi:hypothetical protein